MNGDAFSYVGTELDSFAAARRWKAYLRSQIRPFLASRVLEVGAGIGSTTRALDPNPSSIWLCLEPDTRLAARIASAVRDGQLPQSCQVRVGTSADLGPHEIFDTILYIDILEHLENDADELALAPSHLQPGGHLVVVAPAHPWLYSPFDRAIGHYRRYTKTTLKAAAPAGLQLVRLRYLDSVGMLASAANRLMLGQSMPTRRQIATWDTYMIPLSRLLDPLIFHQTGRSILAVWRKPNP